jgi:integrase
MNIKGIYQKRGFYYYQPPTVQGKRPPAIALKTKDASEAVDRAYDLHSKKALHVQSTDRMESRLDLYLVEQAAAGIHTAKTTDITRKTLKKLAKEWGDPKVSAISKKMVQDWRAELKERPGLVAEKMSEASIGSYLRRLSGFLSWLVKRNDLREHPMKDIRLGRVKKTKREKFCTFEERETLLENPTCAEYDLILHLGFFAGLRFGEMLAMEPGWLTPKEGGWILTVQETAVWKPKDKECRSIEVHPRLQRCLDLRGSKEGFVLAPYKSEWREAPKYRYNPKKGFRNYVEGKGLRWVTYHTLRHSFATHLAMKGVPLVVIAGLLGDSLRVTEETYVGLAPGSQKSTSLI